MKRREFITLIGGAAVAVVTISPVIAAGQDYPSRSNTLIVNFPPGGSTDATARIIREPLSQALGQSIIIDNRGGAGGTTGAAAVANAKPDGYTLLLSVNSALTTNRYLQKNFPFDPKTAFAPITLTSDVALVLAVHPSLPVHDVSGLIEYARKNPGKLAYATPASAPATTSAASCSSRKSGSTWSTYPTAAVRSRCRTCSPATSRWVSARCPWPCRRRRPAGFASSQPPRRRDCPNCRTRPRSTRPFPASSTLAGMACLRLLERLRRSSTSSMRRRWRR